MLDQNRKIDQKTGRALNRRLILNCVRQSRAAGMSRSELAGATGLSSAATGFVVSDLVNEGLLLEDTPVVAGRGRRRVPLKINVSGPMAIGIRLSKGRVECVLADLEMTVIASRSRDVVSDSPDEFVACAAELIAGLVAQPDVRDRPVLGAGLTMPARLDHGSGDCVNSFRFGWRDVPISRMMSDALDLKVSVEDETTAFGLAHGLFGLGREASNLLALAIGDGIGCASLLDGQVRRGSVGNAGKIGHSLFSEDGPLCECGRRGCLQAWFSAKALQREWLRRGGPTSLADAIAASDHDAACLVSHAGEKLGSRLAEWAILLDPEIIVLGGEAVAFGSPFIEPLRTTFRAAHFSQTPPSIVTDTTSFYWSAGAAAVAVRSIFGS